MGGRPCPDLPGVVPLPRPLHEVRADGQARLEQGLLNGARVKAARDIAVQQPRDARVVGVSLEPAQVQQAQLGACEQLVPDRVATGDAQGLITRAVGDRHNAVEDVVGDLLQLMPLGLEVEGIDIRQFLDSGSDPPAQRCFDGRGRGHVQSRVEGRQVENVGNPLRVRLGQERVAAFGQRARQTSRCGVDGDDLLENPLARRRRGEPGDGLFEAWRSGGGKLLDQGSIPRPGRQLVEHCDRRTPYGGGAIHCQHRQETWAARSGLRVGTQALGDVRPRPGGQCGQCVGRDLTIVRGQVVLDARETVLGLLGRRIYVTPIRLGDPGEENDGGNLLGGRARGLKQSRDRRRAPALPQLLSAPLLTLTRREHVSGIGSGHGDVIEERAQPFGHTCSTPVGSVAEGDEEPAEALPLLGREGTTQVEQGSQRAHKALFLGFPGLGSSMPFRSTYAGRVQAPTHLGAQLYVRFDPAGVVQESADIALRRDVRERLRIGAVQHVGDGGGMQVVADGAQGQERTSDELAGGRRVSHLHSPFHLSICQFRLPTFCRSPGCGA